MQGSTKVSPRLRKFRKFRDLCGLLGQIRFGVPKGSVEGYPITSLNLSPSSSALFAFFPNSVSFGVFSHSKGLGSKWHVCLLGCFAANGFRLPKGSLECSPNSSSHWSRSLLRFFGHMSVASEKVLWTVPPTILYICLTVSCGFLGKWLLLQKRFCGRFRQLFLTFVSQSPPGVKVAWIVDMSHPYKSSPQKMTHHVVAVGVFFGFILFKVMTRQLQRCHKHLIYLNIPGTPYGHFFLTIRFWPLFLTITVFSQIRLPNPYTGYFVHMFFALNE